MPLQVVLDDVGWWSGEDGHARNEAYRTGIARHHTPADYAAIVSLGRKLGQRVQAAFVLCEWDVDNILRRVPTATWMGEAWDNRRWVGPWLEAAAGIVRDGADALEVTLHGLGHEHWPAGGGPFTRAEWFDQTARAPRDADDVERHLDAYAAILARHDLAPFPTSFVPCAFAHRFGEGGIAKALKRRGVRTVSTPFFAMDQSRPTETPRLGFDEGVATIDRGACLTDWCNIDAKPTEPIVGPICGLHWPNVLHPDPARNEEVVDRWVNAFRGLDAKPGWMLSRGTEETSAQFAFHSLVEASADGDRAVSFDFSRFDTLPTAKLGDVFTVKAQGPAATVYAGTGCDVVSADRSDGGYDVVRIRRHPRRRHASLRWSPG